MKPFGLRADQREYEQQYYGGYCNKVRSEGLEPMPYTIFQDELREILKQTTTKKERLNRLIERTKKTK